jgi:transposase
MDVHKNARLTPHCRALLVDRVLKGIKKHLVAHQFGVSVTTVDKWLGRFRAEGAQGLEDRSSRPRHSPGATARELQLAVVALRRQRLTLVSIAQQLGLSRATVARVCARAGLNRLSRLEPASAVVRYERARPGELLHLDVKKLGRITQIGHRIHGDHSLEVRGVGWEFVHVAIDDTSRVAYSQVLPDERDVSASAFLRAAVAYYAALGRARERGPHRQRSRLPQPLLRSDLSRARAASSLHQTLHPTYQRQGRAFYPECPEGVGLRACLLEVAPANRSSAPVVTRV